ncbi:MAG: hypothetical protein H7095_08670 [Pseudopedobacter sp.]|nr:hypothetical protein [Deinococcales bacterium]
MRSRLVYSLEHQANERFVLHAISQIDNGSSVGFCFGEQEQAQYLPLHHPF